MDMLDSFVFDGSSMAVDQPTEIVCTRVREKKVPRLPAAASLFRFRLLEQREARRTRGRGRASRLQARWPKLDDFKPGMQQAAGLDHPPSSTVSHPTSNYYDSDKDHTGMAVDPATDTSDSARAKTSAGSTGYSESTSLPCGQIKDVRPKTKQMDRISFTAQHLDMLKDFPALVLKPKQVMNLTRANLDKHAKDMDSVQLSRVRSFEDDQVDTAKRACSDHESVAMYERYQVTLDDIQLFKHQQSQVPQTVKGRVADLLNVKNPEAEHIADNIGSDSNVSNFSEYDGDLDDIYQSETGDSELLKSSRADSKECNKGRKASSVPHNSEMTLCTSNIHEKNISERKSIEPPNEQVDQSNIQVNETNLTNWELPVDVSDTNEMKTTQEATINHLSEMKQKDPLVSSKKANENDSSEVDVPELISESVTPVSETNMTSKELSLNDCKTNETSPSPEGIISQLDAIELNGNLASNSSLRNETIDLNQEENKTHMSNQELPVFNECETEEISVPHEGTIGQLDDIALNDKIAINGTEFQNHINNENNSAIEGFQHEEDDEAFVEVQYKQKKKKHSKKESQYNKPENVEVDNTIWRLYGPCVMQVSGLPEDCDVSVLREMVCGFGMIKDEQIRQVDSGRSMRFKFAEEEDCVYAVEVLHNTESLFSDADCVLHCEQLKF